MSRYPSEQTLAVNAVGEMVRAVPAAERTVALGPTRLRDDGRGYPVERTDATRLAVQFKAPKYEHADRGRCYELTPAGTATLSVRAAPGTAFLALPDVTGRGDLPAALAACRFVAVHAVRTDTSRLFVDAGAGEDGATGDGSPVVTAKIRDETDGRGFDRDPENYYEVPSGAVFTWAELADRLADPGGPLGVRADGAPTAAYRSFLERLGRLSTLYPRPERPTASPAPRDALDDDAAAALLDHAVGGYEESYPDGAAAVDPGAERDALAGVLERMRATRDPALFRVRRCREVVAEFGAPTASPLVLGHTAGEREHEPSPRGVDPAVGGASSGDGPDEGPGRAATLSEFE